MSNHFKDWVVKGVLSYKITWNWDTYDKEPVFQGERENSEENMPVPEPYGRKEPGVFQGWKAGSYLNPTGDCVKIQL